MAFPVRQWQAVTQPGMLLPVLGLPHLGPREDSSFRYVTFPEGFPSRALTATFPGGWIRYNEPKAFWIVCRPNLSALQSAGLPGALFSDVPLSVTGALHVLRADAITNAYVWLAPGSGNGLSAPADLSAWSLVLAMTDGDGLCTIKVNDDTEYNVSGGPIDYSDGIPGDVSHLTLGYHTDGVDAFQYYGDIAEIVVSNQVPTSTQRTQMRNYFAKRLPELGL
jgi:hypothetical protein